MALLMLSALRNTFSTAASSNLTSCPAAAAATVGTARRLMGTSDATAATEQRHQLVTVELISDTM